MCFKVGGALGRQEKGSRFSLESSHTAMAFRIAVGGGMVWCVPWGSLGGVSQGGA